MKQPALPIACFCVVFLIGALFPSSLFAQPAVIIGPALGENTSTTYPTPYGGYKEGMRAQYLYKAGEIITAGGAEGYVTSIVFNISNDNGIGTLQNYKIRLSNSLADSLSTGGWEPAGDLVWDTASFQPVTGGYLHILQTPFHWDGISNLLVEICHVVGNQTGDNQTFNASVALTTGLGFKASRTFAMNDDPGVCGTADTIESGDPHSRPVLTLKFSCLPPQYLSVNATTSVSALLNWGTLGGLNHYNLEVGATGFTPGVDSFLYAYDTLINTILVSPLVSSHSYQAYVRTDCGNGIYSPWVGPVTINTPPGCGDNFFDPGGDSSNYQNNIDTSYTICTGDTSKVATLTFLGFKTIQGDTLRVYNGLDDTAPLLGEFTNNTLPGPFTATNASGCLFITFQSDSINTGIGWSAKITCAVPDSCYDAAGLTLSNLTPTLAHFEWVPTFNADSFAWKLTTPGGVILAQGDTTGTSITFDTLKEATFYKFYIKTYCSGGDSSSWVLISFNTPLECNNVPVINCGANTSGPVFSNSGGIYDFSICNIMHTPGRERIFRYNAPNTRKYNFWVTTASTSNVYVPYFYKDVTMGCGPDDWKCIGEFNKPDSVLFGPLIAGHQYFILFDPESTDPVMQTFRITGCKPTNDEPFQAINLNVGADCSGNIYSNDGASYNLAGGEPNPDTTAADGVAGRWLSKANRTVWFRFTAPPSGTVTVTTDYGVPGSTNDTQLALYSVGDPNDFSTFKYLESDEDNGINDVGLNAAVSYTDLTPGTEYYIQADGFGGAYGTFCIQVFDGAFRTLESACSDLGTTAYIVTHVNGTAAGGDHWYGIYTNPDLFDLGQMAAAVKPGAQDLDTVFCQVNISLDHMIPTAQNGIPYMPAYYNFQSSKAPTLPVRIRVYYYDGEFSDLKAVANQPTATINDLHITHYTGVNQDCLQSNNKDAPGDTTLITAVTAQQGTGTFYLEFSIPTMGEVGAHLGNVALPIVLQSFTGTVEDHDNLLKWITQREKNVEWHIVERSSDGLKWTEIGRKAGKSDSSTPLSYELEDLKPLEKAYYRLRTVDVNGTESVSGSVYLVRRATFGISGLFPSPASDQVTLQFAIETEGTVDIRFVDCMGRLVLEQQQSAAKGQNSVKLQVGSLAAGLYVVTIGSENAVSVPVRMVKQ
jgi:hypothetical protein